MTAVARPKLVVVDDLPDAPDFGHEVESWEQAMFVRRLSPKTMETYLRVVRRFASWLEADDRSTDPAQVTRADCVAYLAARRSDGISPNSLNVEDNALRRFFHFLLGEDVITSSPMVGVDRPRKSQPVTPVLTPDDLGALLGVTTGRDLRDRRDHAIILLLVDTGMRNAELSNLFLEDVDVASGEVRITNGKGAKSRTVRFGQETGLALTRYLRTRRTVRPESMRWRVTVGPVDAERTGTPLWVGRLGPLAPLTLNKVLELRATEAGIGHVKPHQFRHTWAHLTLESGMETIDVQRLGGWSSPMMLQRYGAAGADARARAHYKSPVDRLRSRTHQG